MINRTLIRLKIVQLMYAYYQNGGKNIETAEKELLFSLSKAYDLYNYLLMLMVAISRYALTQVERKEEINRTTHNDEKVNRRFVDNRFVLQLESNLQLEEYKQRRFTSRLSLQIPIRSIWRQRACLTLTTANSGARFTRASS